jgi:hypothetical protein
VVGKLVKCFFVGFEAGYYDGKYRKHLFVAGLFIVNSLLRIVNGRFFVKMDNLPGIRKFRREISIPARNSEMLSGNQKSFRGFVKPARNWKNLSGNQKSWKEFSIPTRKS